jgi:predicted DNA-binding transcriptional regulator YafY
MSRQLERLLRIDELLRSGKRQTATSLAEALERSERTIRNDIAFLRDRYHAPLEFSKSKGFYFQGVTIGSKDWQSLQFSHLSPQKISAY